MSEAVARSVFVISDLHLGGVYSKTPKGRGFRMNTHVNELAQFVQTLAQSPPDGPKVELIINGNMVDFLAEREEAPPYWEPFTNDPEVACAKLQAIAERDRPFFDALGSLLKNGHRLTILMGNHDIELALPSVRKKLKEIIGVEPRHDYEFIYNGEAYVVGDALVEHGNRYDGWNVVSYDRLRRICSLLSRRQPIPEKYAFDPPAGSKMVCWVINVIKEDYKFIDLLKPEKEIAVPVLLALEPGYRQILATVAKLQYQASQHVPEKKNAAMPSIGDDISSGGGPDMATFGSDISTYSEDGFRAQAPSSDEDAALEQVLNATLGGDGHAFLDSLIPAEAQPSIGSDISTADVVDRTFGLARLLLAHDDQDVGRRLPALLKALRALQPDRSFDLDYEADPEYTNAATELLKGGFRYVLFGHTHLAKKIELQPGSFYLNSGTWADLMRLPPEIISGSPDVAMKKLQELVLATATGLLDPWIIFRPTYIRLDLDANDRTLRAELCDYTGAESLRESTPLEQIVR
jgi:UDP-2,3-diacylglucosamine pyrophosphatase LpxH